MKNKKIISILMTSGLLLSSVLATTTQATTVFAETNQEQVESNEITAINVSIKSNLELSYGFDSDYYLNALNNNFKFTDQNGNEIPLEKLDITYRFHDIGTHYFDFDEFMRTKAKNLTGVGQLESRVGLTATLINNPEVKGSQAVNGANGLSIKIVNQAPSINTKLDNPTVLEGTSYQEWENIVFSDLEDDRDGLILQKSVVYPDGFNKDKMKTGEYQIKYRVTDSKGATSETVERLTVAQVFAPEINVNDATLTAENKDFDPLTDLNVSVSDSLDDNPTLEVVENNVNLRKEGEYQVKYRATNKYDKVSEKEVNVKVVAENPTLITEDKTFTINQSQSDIIDILNATASDKVDGDITNNIRVIENNINWNKNGRYTVMLAVTNSNNKSTQVAVNVRVDIKYTLTIDYVDENGIKLAESKVIEANQSTEINENALEIDGYTAKKDTISTVLDDDKSIKFVYVKDEEDVKPPVDPTEPTNPVVPEPEQPVEPTEPTTPTDPEKPTDNGDGNGNVVTTTDTTTTTDTNKETTKEDTKKEDKKDKLYQTNHSNNNILIALATTAIISLLSFITFKRFKK
ncbi:MucBP domain-containing protein [Enterococcus faecalis]|uniref:immunoglobulin-like domain-containing protein n=1 Tax=Enterococcus TaxID=1350 RepID=UPI0008A4698C|nr:MULTISPECIES: immunoglobulin-like domain-containing protein [Enterococcus]EHQ2582860.1 MucBP domain-containing protein [Enterococcus faecalis]EIY9539361.1 MucBP domain-containing protein [Enterococcus faecalis]EKH7152625.1 MucBP domain-containing protein [Enterococcus faecalis]EKI8143140.1 MucBP domain-containing protein [Enterococcus faecalis]EKK5476140.1 MucBP domain-containing protein [Enterococcus faecalis]